MIVLPRRGSPSRSPTRPATRSTTVDGYELVNPLGHGAVATVHRAIDESTGDEVALKLFDADVHAEVDADASAPVRRRFERAVHRQFEWEVSVAGRLPGHPHLLAVLDSGYSSDGRPFLVTPLQRRGTLFDAVAAGGPLRAVEVATIGRQVAFALEALHTNGVVHGDVKPENIFITEDDTVLLGDLGAAWLRAGHPGRGPARALTPAYAAPEVWLGGDPTIGSDLYSLGATLLFAATGAMPVPGVPPDPDCLAAVLGDARQLLAHDPARRPATAAHCARLCGPPAHDDPWEAGDTVGASRLPRPRRAAMSMCSATLTWPTAVDPVAWRGSAADRTA